MTTEAVGSSPGVWASVSQWGSEAGSWLNENVWQAVASFFEACGEHISENQGAYTWTIVGAAVGSTLTMLFAYIYQACHNSAPAAPATTEESSAPLDGEDPSVVASPSIEK